MSTLKPKPIPIASRKHDPEELDNLPTLKPKPIPIAGTLIPPSCHGVRMGSSVRRASARQTCQQSQTMYPSDAFDRACEQFRRDIVAGGVRIEDFLGRVPETQQPALFNQLLRIELTLIPRRQTAESYSERFPQFEPIVRAVFTELAGRESRPPSELPRTFISSVTFTVLSGPQKDLSETFGTGSRAYIGRSRKATLSLPEDPAISRRHVRIEVGSTEVRLFDLESHNGTRLNNQRTTAAVLKNGDILKLGKTQLLVRIENA